MDGQLKYLQFQVSTKMSITSFIKRIAVQDCVYWGNPVNDGFGGTTFDYPVEIKCRWTEKTRILSNETEKN